MSVSYLPTRAEMKARRSQQMHAQRIAAASTPEAQLFAAVGELRAVFAAGHPEDQALTAAEVVRALAQVSLAARQRQVTRAERQKRVRAA